MTKTQIGIIAVAAGIDQLTRETFERSIADSKPACSYIINVITKENRSSFPTRWRDIRPALNETRYRLSATLRHFSPRLYNKSRMLNAGILQLAENCEVIVCTDIDMWVPPGLIDKSYALAREGKHVWCMARYIDRTMLFQSDLLHVPCSEKGKGSWNALSTENWFRSGGWNENMYGWGYEDDAMHLYIQQSGMQTVSITDLPLMHIAHGKRPVLYNAHYNRRQLDNRRGLKPSHV
jgi:hypothetical protein